MIKLLPLIIWMQLLVPIESHRLPELSFHHYDVAPVYMDGMVVPHHDLADDLIESMYQRIPSDVKRVLLLSPDHELNANRKMTLSSRPWSNSQGQVWPDFELCHDLLTLDFIEEDHREIEIEHGLNIHMAYISHYLNARVTPVMISKETTVTEINEFIANIPEDVFVIASVDFSHYKSREEAFENDLKTKELLVSNQMMTLFSMSDAYFDSPHCLYVMMTLFDDFEILEHKNSSDYIGNDYHTTSYMTIGFQKYK